MIRRYCFYLIGVLLLMYFFSCETAPPCDDANGVQANLGFYHYNGTTLNDTLIDSLAVYTQSILQILYYDGTQTATGKLELPLSMISDTSVFIFQFDSGVFDTLEFYYTQETRLISHECGFANFYTLTGATTTHNRIDSVWIRKNLVEYGDDENVKIYF
jgi:hypothetical protein